MKTAIFEKSYFWKQRTIINTHNHMQTIPVDLANQHTGRFNQTHNTSFLRSGYNHSDYLQTYQTPTTNVSCTQKMLSNKKKRMMKFYNSCCRLQKFWTCKKKIGYWCVIIVKKNRKYWFGNGHPKAFDRNNITRITKRIIIWLFRIRNINYGIHYINIKSVMLLI